MDVHPSWKAVDKACIRIIPYNCTLVVRLSHRRKWGSPLRLLQKHIWTGMHIQVASKQGETSSWFYVEICLGPQSHRSNSSKYSKHLGVLCHFEVQVWISSSYGNFTEHGTWLQRSYGKCSWQMASDGDDAIMISASFAHVGMSFKHLLPAMKIWKNNTLVLVPSSGWFSRILKILKVVLVNKIIKDHQNPMMIFNEQSPSIKHFHGDFCCINHNPHEHFQGVARSPP